MIRKAFSISEKMKVSKSRYSKSSGLAVASVNEENGLMQLANISELYDTTLGLSDSKKRENLAVMGGAFIEFGEANLGRK